MTERDEKRMQMWKIFRTHSVKIFVTIRPKPKSRKKLCKINVSINKIANENTERIDRFFATCFFTKTINKLIFPENYVRKY